MRENWKVRGTSSQTMRETPRHISREGQNPKNSVIEGGFQLGRYYGADLMPAKIGRQLTLLRHHQQVQAPTCRYWMGTVDQDISGPSGSGTTAVSSASNCNGQPDYFTPSTILAQSPRSPNIVPVAHGSLDVLENAHITTIDGIAPGEASGSNTTTSCYRRGSIG